MIDNIDTSVGNSSKKNLWEHYPIIIDNRNPTKSVADLCALFLKCWINYMQWLWEFYWNDAKCASDLRSTRDMIAKFSRMCNSAAREVSSKTDHLQKQWAGDLPLSWHRSWKFVQMLFELGETGRKRTQKTNKTNNQRSQTNISNKIFAAGLQKTSVWPFSENFWLLPIALLLGIFKREIID